MSDDYTPATDEVRSRWENSLSHGCANREAMADADWDDGRMVAQFDRWLERVKAEAQVQALEDLAIAHYLDGPQSTYDTIMRRAKSIAREAGIAKGGEQ